jgi:DNA gyrase subunit A
MSTRDDGLTTPPGKDSIVPIPIEDEMKESYIDYAMSVIISRALPDVRDGLKPVHRRILYSMHRQGLASGKPFKKCATVVGDVLGKYHPHGDSSVYDALVRLAQDFSMRYPLVDGQGNFGSVDGDPAAAYRYTEARLTRLAEEMLADIEKETVDFVPNFDGSHLEPTVMPSKVPELLLNGSDGIAVGMATNIPPHNMREVVDMLVHLIDHPEADIDDLLRIVKGPDFPTGGLIISSPDVAEAYRTGRGRIQVRARHEIEELDNGKSRIIVTEIPYQINKARLLETMADLVREKKVEGISDLRDESDRNGMRIVIELKKSEIPTLVYNQLLKQTDLQITFGVNMVALVDNRPFILGLKVLGTEFIKHRKAVVIRRTRYDLKKAKERAHILEGLMIALGNIDAVVALIKASKDLETARSGLMTRFGLTMIQAQAVLDMRLQKLTSLETEKLREELTGLVKEIGRLTDILANVQKVYALIKEELVDLKTRYGDDRRTHFVTESGEFDARDLIADEKKVVTLTRSGYVKIQPLDTYRKQHRGGKGLTGIDLKDEDLVQKTFVADTFDTMIFFTNKGKCYGIEVWKLPEGSRTSRGKAVVNLLALGEGERITALVPVKSFDGDEAIVMVTRQGYIKRTPLADFKGCVRQIGLIAHLFVNDVDELINVALSDGTRSIVVGTKQGMASRFPETQVRTCGRQSRGVIGIRLEEGDEVCGMQVLRESDKLLVVTEKGYGKRTDVSEYRVTNRGVKGVINIMITEKNGLVAAFREVTDTDDIVVTTANGMVIRVPSASIRHCGRNTQGVRVIDLAEGDRVVAVTVVAPEEGQTDGDAPDAAASEPGDPSDDTPGGDSGGDSEDPVN